MGLWAEKGPALAAYGNAAICSFYDRLEDFHRCYRFRRFFGYRPYFNSVNIHLHRRKIERRQDAGIQLEYSEVVSIFNGCAFCGGNCLCVVCKLKLTYGKKFCEKNGRENRYDRQEAPAVPQRRERVRLGRGGDFDKSWHHGLLEEKQEHLKENRQFKFTLCPTCKMAKGKIKLPVFFQVFLLFFKK